MQFSPFPKLFSTLSETKPAIYKAYGFGREQNFVVHLDTYIVDPIPDCITRYSLMTHPGGSVVNLSDSWPGGCEFDPLVSRTFFSAYFRLSPLQKHLRKEVGGFGKINCFSTGVRNDLS